MSEHDPAFGNEYFQINLVRVLHDRFHELSEPLQREVARELRAFTAAIAEQVDDPTLAIHRYAELVERLQSRGRETRPPLPGAVSTESSRGANKRRASQTSVIASPPGTSSKSSKKARGAPAVEQGDDEEEHEEEGDSADRNLQAEDEEEEEEEEAEGKGKGKKKAKAAVAFGPTEDLRGDEMVRARRFLDLPRR